MPSQIQIAELDYDQILQNIIEFMKADPAFADYDFAGSGLRLIARVLAYVTFYMNFYLTQAVNESFLNTAQLRSSVSALARMLGYDIKGTQSARLFANVAVQLTDTSASDVTLPKNTRFTLQANSSFNFYSVEDAVLSLNASSLVYEAADVQLVEGTPLTYRFTVDLTNPTQQFVIPNANVDYGTITVQVQESDSSNTITTFIRGTNFLTISSTDPAFFVQENYNGFPELTFGNGVVGKALDHGNIIIASYFISRGAAGNNIRGPFDILSANIAGFVRGATNADAKTAPSSGGADAEDLDTARFLAPLAYQAQNRCVTAEDYKTTLLAQYGENIAAVNVFGGEQGDPNDPLERPTFGKVFIALKPKIGLHFTDIVRDTIMQTIIQPRSIVGVVPVLIDPDYIYMVVSSSVKYDPKATTLTKLQLQNAVQNSILAFAQDNIEKFNTAFRFSKFVRVIDDTDPAIVSSLTRLDLEKRIYPVFDTSNQYVLKFGAPLRRVGNTSVILESTSHRFTYTDDAGTTQEKCFFYEQDGVLHIAYRNTSNQLVIFVSNIGTVDVTTGLVTITNFAPSAIEDDAIDIRLRIIPAVNDFIPRLNQMFTIDPDEVVVQLLNDSVATVDDQITFFAGGILP